MTWNKNKAEVELNKWFTPSKPATKNYVDRGNLDRTIFREFSQQGRQVLVFGPTGAGKTSMVLDNLEKLKKQYHTNSVRVTMTKTTTLNSFIAEIARKLKVLRPIQTEEINEDDTTGNVGVNIGIVNAKINESGKTSVHNTLEPYAVEDGFSELEDILFRTNTVLVVDDMENLSEQAENLRTRLAEVAKNMSDDAVNYDESYAKIVFVGIADTAEQLWHDVESLKSRLATISVPYLNNEESHQIIKLGWDKAKLKSTELQMNNPPLK